MVAILRSISTSLIMMVIGSFFVTARGVLPTYNVLVQSTDVVAASRAVEAAGGTLLRPLSLINAVEAKLSAEALAQLRMASNIKVYPNQSVQSAQQIPAKKDDAETGTAGYTLYPAAAVQVQALHEQTVEGPKVECKDQLVQVSSDRESRPLRGHGVTVAVIDSGFVEMASQGDWKYRLGDGTLIAENSGRCVIYRDFLPRNSANGNSGNQARNSADQHGHGTHVAATIIDNREVPLAANSNATPVGVAPQANLLVARALDKNGAGTYADVIAAIDWVVANKARYNVGVLNLSLYAPASAPYWADPLGQSVMRAWQAGIVVVVAAGNAGPAAGTITVPGNVPYVITVGAMRSGRYSPDGYDELATYSSRGPTESAFIKPDILVPASRTIAPMPKDSTLELEMRNLAKQEKCKSGGSNPGPIRADLPSYCWYENATIDVGVGAASKQHAYYQLSGTSMAAAEVSGIVALMLQANPGLSNDQVKARLIQTARLATDANDVPAYSFWEQGAGLVDAQAAVLQSNSSVANAGMDLALDLQTFTDGRDEQHYWGHTIWDEVSGEFRLVDPDSGESLQVWDTRNRAWFGGNRAWFGGNRAWFGANRAWFGGNRAWFGGNRAWFGGSSLWAGSTRPWVGLSGGFSAASAASTGLLVDDDEILNQSTIYLPMIQQ